jgi:hypothetical protein
MSKAQGEIAFLLYSATDKNINIKMETDTNILDVWNKNKGRSVSDYQISEIRGRVAARSFGLQAARCVVIPPF